MGDNVEIAVKILAAFGSIYLVWKNSVEIKKIEFSKLFEDYENTENVLKNIEKSEHIIVIEKGLRVIAGTRTLSSVEIVHLISFENPLMMIAKYCKAKEYVAFVKSTTGMRIAYKNRYSNNIYRQGMKALNFIASCAILVFLLTLILMYNKISDLFDVYSIVVLVPISMLLLWEMMKSAAYIGFAEYLVKNQIVNAKEKEFRDKMLNVLTGFK